MISALHLLFIFIIGLVFGSFFNVIGFRAPLKQSIVRPRSRCPYCHDQLTAIELIPVISFFVQRGKCRHCKRRISFLYPMIELLTGFLFAAAFFLIGWEFELVVVWTFMSLLLIVFVTDVTYMVIPNKILLTFAAIFLVERFIIPLNPWWDSLLGGVIALLIPLFIAMISKGGMGGGDIKLFALLGFALGTQTVLLSLFLATFYGALFGGIGLLLGIVQKASRYRLLRSSGLVH